MKLELRADLLAEKKLYRLLFHLLLLLKFDSFYKAGPGSQTSGQMGEPFFIY